MNELVFLEPNSLGEVPFTTSKIIARNGKVEHETIVRLISKYEEDIQEFGILRFEIGEIKGRGQPEKIYRLNEQQATLLITYMKNTLPVRTFKKVLVKQFYIMYQELNKRAITRERAKQAREYLTNAIRELPESPHKSMKYKHYTDLIYKIVFGKNAKQLREQFNISKSNELRNYFSSDEIEKVERLEKQISSLIELGNGYETIKMILTQKFLQTA